MKVKKGFNLRNVCGEEIIVAEGEENIDFSNIISMNESSSALWKEAQSHNEFTIDSLAKYLCSLYEVDATTARNDVEALVKQWAAAGIIEGEDLPDYSDVIMEKQPTADSDVTSQRVETPKKKGFFSRLFGK